MSSYVKTISLVMVLLCLAALFLATRLGLYPPAHGLGAVLFMGLNALAAVYPLYRYRQKNPFQLYLLGMVVRLGVIGAVLMALITLGGLDRNGLLAITFTAMFAFTACLAVEIRFFLTQNAFFQGRA